MIGVIAVPRGAGFNARLHSQAARKALIMIAGSAVPTGTRLDVAFDLQAPNCGLVVIHAAGTARAIRVAGLHIALHSDAAKGGLIVIR